MPSLRHQRQFVSRIESLPVEQLADQNPSLFHFIFDAANHTTDPGTGNSSDLPQDIAVQNMAEAAADSTKHRLQQVQGIINLRRRVASKYLTQALRRPFGPKFREAWASTMSTKDFAMMILANRDVAVSPGSGFGESGGGLLRLVLVENENRLRQAVRQIGRCLELGQVSPQEVIHPCWRVADPPKQRTAGLPDSGDIRSGRWLGRNHSARVARGRRTRAVHAACVRRPQATLGRETGHSARVARGHRTRAVHAVLRSAPASHTRSGNRPRHGCGRMLSVLPGQSAQ